MADIDGIADYPMIIAPHPLTGLSDDELRARAELLTPAVARVLLEGLGGEVML